MGVQKTETTAFSPVPAEKLFKGSFLDMDTVVPKAFPEGIKSVQVLEGDGGVGTIKNVTLGDATPFNTMKTRIDAIDEHALTYTYTIIGGDILLDIIESIENHFKIVPANGIGMNMNGVNHQAFMQNNQAAMAAYQAAAANGHTSPPPNMYMAQNNAASPSSRPMQMPNLQQQVLQLEQHFKSKNPKLTNEQARNQAMSHISSILARQNAMNSAAGVNGGQQAQHAGLAATANVAATTSPHQYAAMLRQHQQQQAAQQAQAQQAQQTPNASSPGQSSHHRQSSEGATPGAVT